MGNENSSNSASAGIANTSQYIIHNFQEKVEQNFDRLQSQILSNNHSKNSDENREEEEENVQKNNICDLPLLNPQQIVCRYLIYLNLSKKKTSDLNGIRTRVQKFQNFKLLLLMLNSLIY